MGGLRGAVVGGCHKGHLGDGGVVLLAAHDHLELGARLVGAHLDVPARACGGDVVTNLLPPCVYWLLPNLAQAGTRPFAAVPCEAVKARAAEKPPK